MKLIEAYLKNTAQRARRARLFRRAGALLSAIVILFTMNTLKLNADTLERLPMCGIEAHVHSIEEDCFALAEDGVSYVLICDRPEHVHEDACFQQRPDYSSQELEAAVEAQPVEAADGEIQAEDEGLFVDAASIRDYALGSDSGDEPEGDVAETLATEGGESVKGKAYHNNYFTP